MRVCILGGGLSGLISGKILSENGFEVKVIEKEDVLGGLARSFEIDGFKIPVFYHHIFSHDKETLKVIKEVGLRNDLIKKKIKMAINYKGKNYFISPLSALFWDFLTAKDKFRFGLLAVHAKIKNSWDDLEGLNAHEWLEKKVGSNVRRKIFENLMHEKYGLPLKRISASELAERLGEGEATGKFCYPRKGMQEMIERIAKKIEKNGGHIERSSEVRKIDLKRKEIEYMNKRIRKEKYDIVISTIPIPAFLKAAKGLPSAYAEKLKKIKYTKNICVNIGMEEKLSEYYWINVFGNVFGGVIEHTNLADIYPFKMAWVFKYAPPDEIWKLNDRQIGKLFASKLRGMFPDLKETWIRVFRSRYASPTYDIEYKNYMPEYKTPVDSLFFSGIALTYPKLRTMNTAFISGAKTAETVIDCV